jgi:hypothetical protein
MLDPFPEKREPFMVSGRGLKYINGTSVKNAIALHIRGPSSGAFVLSGNICI